MSRSIRTPLVAGNWKMNLDHIQAVDWMKSYSKSNNGWMERCKTNGMVTTPVELAVFPSFTSLGVISTMASKLAPGLGYGAQTISEPRSGAFTGDVSAGMLSALGCKYVILGHSEQRRYHPEDDGKIASKVKVVLDTGMQPIVCIGETKCGRDHGISLDYALSQLADANHVASLAPDLLRDEIWSERLEIIGRFMILVEHGEVRGVDSVPEWLVEIDETLSQDEKYRKLVEARADWSARQAYGEIADDGMPFDLFCRVYKAGYMADDADTRNRHWRQRGVDKRVQPWRTV